MPALPAAVDATWVPWPLPSRGDKKSVRCPGGVCDSYVEEKERAPITLVLHSLPVNELPASQIPLNLLPSALRIAILFLPDRYGR